MCVIKIYILNVINWKVFIVTVIIMEDSLLTFLYVCFTKVESYIISTWHIHLSSQNIKKEENQSLLSFLQGDLLKQLFHSYAVLSHSVLSDSWRPPELQTTGSSVHGDAPGKDTGVGCHDLLQGIFPTQGSNAGLPHCRRILYWLSYQVLQHALTIRLPVFTGNYTCYNFFFNKELGSWTNY